jgi:hypothetical protein
MKTFSRSLFAAVIGAVIVLGLTTNAFAQRRDFGLKQTVAATGNLLPESIGGADTVPELVGTIVASVLGFLGVIFFLIIFYAGLVWMTAQGAEEKIERSKEMISAAVVGLVIVLAAYAFTQFVFDELAQNRASSAASAVDTDQGVITDTDSSAIDVTALRAECLANKTSNDCTAPCEWLDAGAGQQGSCYLP